MLSESVVVVFYCQNSQIWMFCMRIRNRFPFDLVLLDCLEIAEYLIKCTRFGHNIAIGIVEIEFTMGISSKGLLECLKIVVHVF